MSFRTQFYRALIQKVKIRNDTTFTCKGADRGPKFISNTKILYEVGRPVILKKTIFLIMLKLDDCSITPLFTEN